MKCAFCKENIDNGPETEVKKTISFQICPHCYCVNKLKHISFSNIINVTEENINLKSLIDMRNAYKEFKKIIPGLEGMNIEFKDGFSKKSLTIKKPKISLNNAYKMLKFKTGKKDTL